MTSTVTWYEWNSGPTGWAYVPGYAYHLFSEEYTSAAAAIEDACITMGVKDYDDLPADWTLMKRTQQTTVVAAFDDLQLSLPF